MQASRWGWRERRCSRRDAWLQGHRVTEPQVPRLRWGDGAVRTRGGATKKKRVKGQKVLVAARSLASSRAVCLC